ncbi:hypothetical protein, partial [Riemerella anatipestifer]|uniref:hypothetical protein n=1 Tax=Riemerella anatipestifer TaxID=34085 RepID=UPI001F42621F
KSCSNVQLYFYAKFLTICLLMVGLCEEADKKTTNLPQLHKGNKNYIMSKQKPLPLFCKTRVARWTFNFSLYLIFTI